MDIEHVQDMLDSGIPVVRIAESMGIEKTKIFRLIQKGLVEKYIPFDEEKSSNAIPLSEIDKMVYITSDLKVLADLSIKSELEKQGDWGSRESEYLKETKLLAKFEAIERFVMSVDPTLITNDLLDTKRHIKMYIYQCFGNYGNFRKHYGIYTIFMDNCGAATFMSDGYEFERLLGEVLGEVFSHDEIQRTPWIGDCRPDFVIGSKWFDAKLCRSTALYSNCTTISKYREYTDDLTIVYAVHDTRAKNRKAKFICVKEFYPYISNDLRIKCEDFIAEVLRKKEMTSHCKKIS